MKFVPTKLLNVSLHIGGEATAVGRLALVRRKIYFEYATSFLSKGLEISPVKLPLKPGAQTALTGCFDGLFGVFNDSLPDGWGRLLLDRRVQSLGVAPELLGPLDRLTHVGKFGMGALVYEPCITINSSHHQQLDLEQIAQECARISAGEVEQISPELFELAGSSAGARPKVMLGISDDLTQFIHGQQNLPEGYEHWMIKFASNNDSRESGAIEYAYSLMAEAAGVEMMPTKLFGSGKSRYFGVKRFDRIGNHRLHMHSLSGLIDADHQSPTIDYDHVLRSTMFLTRNASEVKKAFRLACFNVFAHNRDDHAKNFAFLMDSSGNWRMAPAFDLTFSNGPGGEHSTTVLGEGAKPQEKNLHALAERFDIPRKDSNSVIEQVRGAVSDWMRYSEMAGVSKKVASLINKEMSG